MDYRDFFNEFIKKPKVEFVLSTLERAWEAGFKPAIEVVVYEQDAEIMVPMEFVRSGKITLIMGAADIRDYHFDKTKGVIHFSASFAGRPASVIVPVAAITTVAVDRKVLGIGFPSWFETKTLEEEQKEPEYKGNVVSMFNNQKTKH